MDGTTSTEAPASGLMALGSVTKETDAANPAPEVVQAQQQKKDADTELEAGAKSWGQVMFSLGGAVTMIAPELQQVYAPERCLDWGRHAYLVGKKYGWKCDTLPELALLSSTMGFLVPTVLVIRAKAKQVKDAKEAGLFGRMVMWWRLRQVKKAHDQAQPPAEGAPPAEAAA